MNERAQRVARRFEVPVVVAALLVVPVIAVEQSRLGEPWDTLAAVTNWAIWLVFAAELAAMLAVVDDRPRWLVRHPLEVAVVVLTPPFFPASLQVARLLRLLLLLRLVQLAPLVARVFSLEGLRYAGLLALLTALGGGAAFSAAEGRAVTTWDGVWWALTTMTTVGYGDLTPVSTLGRVVAIFVMLVGIGFVAILTAAFAQRFLAPHAEEELAGETDILRELERVSERLGRIERRLGDGRPPS